MLRVRNLICARFGRPCLERGQATVEFALILIPLLIIVVGVIQFGIALNFWLDEQRIANQGARFAVVNSWPGCPRSEPVPLGGANCTGTNTLQAYLGRQALSQGLRLGRHQHLLPRRWRSVHPDRNRRHTGAGESGGALRVPSDHETRHAESQR